jgi:hypothetical protein
LELLSETLIHSFEDREKSIAYNIIKQPFQNPSEENFLAMVGVDHLMKVTKQIVEFINKGDDYLSYKRPDSFISDPRLDTDIKFKQN